MLLSFSAKNFRSIYGAQTLCFEPTSLKEYPDNFFEKGQCKALKSLVLLGHNASGKSNIIKAIAVMNFLIHLSQQFATREKLPFENFKYNLAAGAQPTEFEIEVLVGDLIYYYSFGYTDKGFSYENLYVKDNKPRARERLVFSRNLQEFEFGGDFKLKLSKHRVNTSPFALFLNVSASFNEEISMNLVRWFRECLVTIDVSNLDTLPDITSEFIHSNRYKDRILKILADIDVCIKSVNVDKKQVKLSDIPSYISLPKEIKEGINESEVFSFSINSIHSVYDGDKECDKVDMDFMSTESEGTKKFFQIIGIIVDCLEKGKTLFVDELDAQLHPLLFYLVVKMFNSKNNVNNAQLVFTSLDHTILDNGDLRRDQVILVEKNEKEESIFYPLSQFKVRNDVSFAKSYLLGRFGAIPNLPSRLKWM